MEQLQSPCSCVKDPRPRRYFIDMKLSEVAEKAWDLGFDSTFSLSVPGDLEKLGNLDDGSDQEKQIMALRRMVA